MQETSPPNNKGWPCGEERDSSCQDKAAFCHATHPAQQRSALFSCCLQAKALFPTNASEKAASVQPGDLELRRAGSAANSLAKPSASLCSAQSQAPASDWTGEGSKTAAGSH